MTIRSCICLRLAFLKHAIIAGFPRRTPTILLVAKPGQCCQETDDQYPMKVTSRIRIAAALPVGFW
jgi:hypothetical protein